LGGKVTVLPPALHLIKRRNVQSQAFNGVDLEFSGKQQEKAVLL
jgi:hypothetical protein